MELTLVGLQNSGKTTFVNVIAVSLALFGCGGGGGHILINALWAAMLSFEVIQCAGRHWYLLPLDPVLPTEWAV